MSSQRIVQLLISFAILTAVVLVSDKSRSIAAILAVFPINVVLALWLVTSANPGDPTLPADLSRMMLLGLFPVAVFLTVCWIAFRRGASFVQAILLGYLVWGLAMGTYKGIEWWLSNRTVG